MAGRVRTLNKPLIQQTWSIVVPRVGDSIESPPFQMEGGNWKFRLQTVWYVQDEEWIMHILKCSKDADEKLCLTAYVRDGTDYMFMAHKEISPRKTVIWNISRRAFSESYPRVKVDEKIDFSFEILTLRNFSQSSVHDKSVQTPSPVVPPPYSDDRLCLNNLSLALRKLVDEGSDSDVQLKCGECSIAAHKLILGVRSEVFRTMLQSDMLEKREGVIEIVDMEPKIFEIFIRYLYTGILPELTEDTATSLYEASDKYLVEALRERCGDFMVWNLTRENALRILVMADAHSDEDLKDKVVTYVLNEELPSNNDVWSKFCDYHPKLAIEVFNRAYNRTSCSQ